MKFQLVLLKLVFSGENSGAFFTFVGVTTMDATDMPVQVSLCLEVRPAEVAPVHPFLEVDCPDMYLKV